MKKRISASDIIYALDKIIYWSIVLIPFSVAIAPAPMNTFMGFLIISFLAKKILKKERLFTKTALNSLLLFLFIMTCISTVNSINYRDSIKGGILRLLQYIFIFFIMAEEVKDQRHIRRIFSSVALGLFFASCDGMWQVFTGRDFIRKFKPIENLGLLRATASFKDANTFGVYLSAMAPFLFGLALYYLKGTKKIAYLFISIIVLAGIALTYSRPTLLATYVAIFFLGAAKRDKVLVGFLIIFALVSPFLLPRSVKEWAKEMNYNPLIVMCNEDRIAIYRNSINMIQHHPIVGVGANNFMKNYRFYKESPEFRNIVTSEYLYAHNNFLHMAAEIGLIGLGIFIWLLFKSFKECINIYRHLQDPFLKISSLSLSACLIAFLINGLTESSLYYSRVAIVFWYIMGFSLALKRFVDANRQ